jgi:hypothetical protein
MFNAGFSAIGVFVVGVLCLNVSCRETSKSSESLDGNSLVDSAMKKSELAQLPKARPWPGLASGEETALPPADFHLSAGENNDVASGPQKAYWCSTTWVQVSGVIKPSNGSSISIPVGSCYFIDYDSSGNRVGTVRSCSCGGKPITAVWGTDAVQPFPPPKPWERAEQYDRSNVYEDFFYVGSCGNSNAIARVVETTTCNRCPVDDHVLGNDGMYPDWDAALEANKNLFEAEHMSAGWNAAFTKASKAVTTAELKFTNGTAVELAGMKGPGRRTGNYQRHLFQMWKKGKEINQENNQKYLDDYKIKGNKFPECYTVIQHASAHWGWTSTSKINVPSEVAKGVKGKSGSKHICGDAMDFQGTTNLADVTKFRGALKQSGIRYPAIKNEPWHYEACSDPIPSPMPKPPPKPLPTCTKSSTCIVPD